MGRPCACQGGWGVFMYQIPVNWVTVFLACFEVNIPYLGAAWQGVQLA